MTEQQTAEFRSNAPRKLRADNVRDGSQIGVRLHRNDKCTAGKLCCLTEGRSPIFAFHMAAQRRRLNPFAGGRQGMLKTATPDGGGSPDMIQKYDSVRHVGDWVEVRSSEEILATLDEKGELDNLPFMPEMLRFCGKRFQVFKSAHKSCDTATGFGTGKWLGVELDSTLHLDLRCDGSAHGGCQAACLLFWKEAWLKPVAKNAGAAHKSDGAPHLAKSACGTTNLLAATASVGDGGRKRYSCQATRLPAFSRPLPWWRFGQYWRDYRSGNISARRLFDSFAYAAYRNVTLAERRTLGRPGRWLYDRFQQMRGGVPFPARKGKLPPGKGLARDNLDLQPGEWVRVKPYEAILATVDVGGSNRNLNFADEMVPYCGGVYRVRDRVARFVDEATGYMREMKTPAVILENVVCQACYSRDRIGCPRGIYSWWREIWLERVNQRETAADSEQTPLCSHRDRRVPVEVVSNGEG